MDFKDYKGQTPWAFNFKEPKPIYNEGDYIADSQDPTWNTNELRKEPKITPSHFPGCGYWWHRGQYCPDPPPIVGLINCDGDNGTYAIQRGCPPFALYFVVVGDEPEFDIFIKNVDRVFDFSCETFLTDCPDRPNFFRVKERGPHYRVSNSFFLLTYSNYVLMSWNSLPETVLPSNNYSGSFSDGFGPFSINVEGLGFWLDPGFTLKSLSNWPSRSFSFYTDADACGTGSFEVTDDCGFSLIGASRCTGRWESQYILQGNWDAGAICIPPGGYYANGSYANTDKQWNGTDFISLCYLQFYCGHDLDYCNLEAYHCTCSESYSDACPPFRPNGVDVPGECLCKNLGPPGPYGCPYTEFYKCSYTQVVRWLCPF